MPAPFSTREAFERYVLPELPVLLRVARALTHNDPEAEDLVQDTLVRALRGIDAFDGRYPRAWLLTILRNTHINRHRRRRPELLRDPDDVEDVASEDDRGDPLAHVDQPFDAAVDEALNTLTGPFRGVVDLVDIRGLSYAEAARELGIPVGTVMSRLHRARRRMRAHLETVGVTSRSTR